MSAGPGLETGGGSLLLLPPRRKLGDRAAGGPVDGLDVMRHVEAMIRLLVSLHRAVLVAAIAVALVATGFAHRLPTAAEDGALGYALQNGISVTDLCGGDPGKSSHPGVECKACQITGAASLSALTGVRIEVELAFHAAVIAPLEVWSNTRTRDPAHRPQGPPVA